MAWQRDAAKAGAPLSREPLASLKAALSERVKVVEDLQNQAMVQREAAVLLAQRIELLSTKRWKDAQAVAEALRADVAHWQAQAERLRATRNWASVEPNSRPMIESSRAQLLVVWDAFSAALAQAVAADADASRAAAAGAGVGRRAARRAWPCRWRRRPGRPSRRSTPPYARNNARAPPPPSRRCWRKWSRKSAKGHGKASAGAAAALRNAFKDHGRHLDAALEARVHAALGAAGELEGWQRWRADQLREELVAKAEALLQRKPGQPSRSSRRVHRPPPATEVASCGNGGGQVRLRRRREVGLTCLPMPMPPALRRNVVR